MFDPMVGVWLSEEPEEGGDLLNLYRYVGNSPTNATDPYGLFAVAPADFSRIYQELTPAARDAVSEMMNDTETGSAAAFRQWVHGISSYGLSRDQLKSDIQARIEAWQQEYADLEARFRKYLRDLSQGLAEGRKEAAVQKARTQARLAAAKKAIEDAGHIALQSRDYYLLQVNQELAGLAATEAAWATEKGGPIPRRHLDDKERLAELKRGLTSTVPLEEFRLTIKDGRLVSLEALTDDARYALKEHKSLVQLLGERSLWDIGQRLAHTFEVAVKEPSLVLDGIKEEFQALRDNIGTVLTLAGAAAVAASNPWTAGLAAVVGYTLWGKTILDFGRELGKSLVLTLEAESDDDYRWAAREWGKVVAAVGVGTLTGVAAKTLADRAKAAKKLLQKNPERDALASHNTPQQPNSGNGGQTGNGGGQTGNGGGQTGSGGQTGNTGSTSGQGGSGGGNAGQTGGTAATGSGTNAANAGAQGGVKLTGKGRKAIGNLAHMKDKKLADAIKERGGGQGQVQKLDSPPGEDVGQMTVGEIANAAGKGEPWAVAAIKMLKQAGSQGKGGSNGVR